MKRLSFGFLFLAAGCGQAPDLDSRHSDVVVESAGLEAAAAEAASWWYEQTGSEVAFNVADACAPGRVCVRIHLGRLDTNDAGLTVYPLGHPESRDTTVSEALDPSFHALTIAHELGHVLDLAHDDGVMTAAVDEATWALPSEWAGSAR